MIFVYEFCRRESAAMFVVVRAQGPLKRFRPDGRERFSLDLPAGATVLDLITASTIPWDEVGVVAVNGVQADEQQYLVDGDEVLLLAPMEGG
jgi:sulfur carrier protein ThiS